MTAARWNTHNQVSSRRLITTAAYYTDSDDRISSYCELRISKGVKTILQILCKNKLVATQPDAGKMSHLEVPLGDHAAGMHHALRYLLTVKLQQNTQQCMLLQKCHHI